MNQQELRQVQMTKPVPDVLSIKHLRNRTPRTLLLGYDVDRTTVHIYICPTSGEIKTTVYGGYNGMSPRERIASHNQDYIPTKRLYPECCDYEFCTLLKESDVYMSFTTWEERKEEQFYGKTS